MRESLVSQVRSNQEQIGTGAQNILSSTVLRLSPGYRLGRVPGIVLVSAVISHGPPCQSVVRQYLAIQGVILGHAKVVEAPYLQNRNLLGRYQPRRSAALDVV